MSLALLLALLALQGPVGPQLAEPAPPLTPAQLLQAPEGTSATWEALRGKAVVLEFWATWCGPCVDHIPQLNALAERFKDRPVQFISITDEESAIVDRFLLKHPIVGWVAVDSEASTFTRYSVSGRPTTILVDAQGILRAITGPGSVTDSVLEDLLAGKALDLRQPFGSPFIGMEPTAPTPLIQVLIRPAAPIAVTHMSPGAHRSAGGRYEAWGLTLLGLLSDTYGIPTERIEAPEWCNRTRYDLTLITPQGGESDGGLILQQVLVAAFRLKLRHEMRETDVYILRKQAGNEPKLRPATTQGRSGRWDRSGELEAIGVPLGRLVLVSQSVLGRPVLDETDLKGWYDFNLKWNGKGPASIVVAVREQLGLELVPARRPLEYLVVESAEERKTW